MPRLAQGRKALHSSLPGSPRHVERGAARLADGTITGSVLTMDQALRNTLRMMPVSLSEAVGMLTLNPARSIHVDDRKGRLCPGYDADLLLFSPDLTLQATFCRGQLAYATDAGAPDSPAFSLSASRSVALKCPRHLVQTAWRVRVQAAR